MKISALSWWMVAVSLGVSGVGCAGYAGDAPPEAGAVEELAGQEAAVADGDEPIAAAAGSPCRATDRGRVLGYEKVNTLPTAAATRAYFKSYIDLNTEYGYVSQPVDADIDHGVDSYRVTYCTVDAALADQTTGERGSRRPTVATGMLSVPRRSGPKSVVLYLHGTSVSYYDAPSNVSIEESFDGPAASSIFAGAGFIYVAPDYLGLGGSDLAPHRYFHAASEATSSVDMLAAARSVLSTLQIKRSDRLFLFGFSQGGHAALATQRELERVVGLGVTATATTGGVYDPESFFLTAARNETTATLPLYSSYLLVAYDALYNVYAKPSDVFRPAYAPLVGGLFDMQQYFDDVVAALGPSVKLTLRPSFYGDVLADPQHPMRVRLRQNQVDNWRPCAPIRDYHSPTDEEVAYGDIQASVQQLEGQGADVTLTTMSPDLDHVNAWYQSMPRAVTWFRSLE